MTTAEPAALPGWRRMTYDLDAPAMTTSTTTIIRAAALAAAATAALATASPAHADSISFIKGGDVWVAAPDGTSQVQVTHDGGYSYASRADDGSFIALHGRRLHRLSPTGQLVADFDTPVSGEQTAPNTSFFRGPFKPEISPDGTKVAYEYWYQAFLSDPGCAPVGTPTCTDKRVSVGIGYSYSDRQTSWDEPGLGRQSGWVDPSWIDNTTLMQSYKSVRPNVDAIIDHPGDGNQTIQEWFQDDNAWYLKDGEISRRGDAAAFVSGKPRDASDPLIGQVDDQVTIYRLNGAPPALPEQCFSYYNPDLIYASPTFAPDGAHLAFTAENRTTHEMSLVVGELPSQAGGCALPASGGKVIMTGVTAPDWSPAPVPTIPSATPTAGGGSGAGKGPGQVLGAGAAGVGAGSGSASGAGGGGTAAFSVVASKGALRGAARGRLPLTLTVPSAGRLRVTVIVRGRTVGTGSARPKASGPAAVNVAINAAGRRVLRSGRKVTATVRYRFTPAAGTATQGQTTIALSR